MIESATGKTTISISSKLESFKERKEQNERVCKLLLSGEFPDSSESSISNSKNSPIPTPISQNEREKTKKDNENETHRIRRNGSPTRSNALKAAHHIHSDYIDWAASSKPPRERDETLICPKNTHTHKKKKNSLGIGGREIFEQWAGAENKNGIPAEERETEISLSSSC